MFFNYQYTRMHFLSLPYRSSGSADCCSYWSNANRSVDSDALDKVRSWEPYSIFTVIMICCSLPPKYTVIFIDKEHETFSGIIENGHSMCRLDPTLPSELGMTQTSELDMIDHSKPSMIQWSERQPYLSTVTGNERVTAADHWQDVRLLTFDITGSLIT